MTKRLLCIFHGGCDDGFGAAWAVRQALGDENVEFYPGVYQQPPPDVTDRHVAIVDVSYKRPVLLEMAAKAHSVLILDHHKSAQEDLSGISSDVPMGQVPDFDDYCERFLFARNPPPIRPIIWAEFDMNRSGAGMTWDYFMGHENRPEFINYLEDRDLWRKRLPRGDEFTIALRSYPQDFTVWNQLCWDSGVDRLISEGTHIQRYYRARIEELKRSAYPAVMEIGDNVWVTCRIANAPYFAASEVAGELCGDDVDFGASYFEVRPGLWQYSLRSRGEFDVSKVALTFGGGGHRNAAGFTAKATAHSRVYTSDGGFAP